MCGARDDRGNSVATGTLQLTNPPYCRRLSRVTSEIITWSAAWTSTLSGSKLAPLQSGLTRDLPPPPGMAEPDE